MIPKEVNYLSGERGMALIIALLLMVVVTVLGTGAIITSSTDIQISGNYKTSQEVLHGADGGVQIVQGIINRAFDGTGVVTFNTDTVFVPNDVNFPLEPRITDVDGDGDIDSNDYDHNDSNNIAQPRDIQTNNNVDLIIPLQDMEVLIDVDVTPRNLLGFSIEFASAYEGIGSGTQGGSARFYRINSGGREEGSANVTSILEAEYRRMF
jgi:hypothetical protein